MRRIVFLSVAMTAAIAVAIQASAETPRKHYARPAVPHQPTMETEDVPDAQSAMPVAPPPPSAPGEIIPVQAPMPMAPSPIGGAAMPPAPQPVGTSVVYCIVPQGYCPISTTSPVLPGTDCSCDGMAGKTQ